MPKSITETFPVGKYEIVAVLPTYYMAGRRVGDELYADVTVIRDTTGGKMLYDFSLENPKISNLKSHLTDVRYIGMVNIKEQAVSFRYAISEDTFRVISGKKELDALEA